MLNTGWIYDLMIIIYAISVLGYFIDFLTHNRKVNRIAFWLLSIVWILQTIFLFTRMLQTDRLPFLSLFEGLYFYAWVLVTFSLVVNRLFKVDLFVFFTNVLGFIFMAFHLFVPAESKSPVLAQQLISELLIIHITFAMLAYVAFSLSFIFSVMYFLQYEMLKKKKWNRRLRRLSDLSMLDRFSYVLNMIGLPMLLISLILGTIWAYLQIDNFHLLDPKVIGSFIVLVAYGIYLYIRVVKGIQGKTITKWNIGAFLVLLINFFLFGSLSRFHIWYG